MWLQVEEEVAKSKLSIWKQAHWSKVKTLQEVAKNKLV